MKIKIQNTEIKIEQIQIDKISIDLRSQTVVVSVTIANDKAAYTEELTDFPYPHNLCISMEELEIFINNKLKEFEII